MLGTSKLLDRILSFYSEARATPVMGLSEGAITVLAVSIVFLLLSYAALAARLWSRRMMKLKLAFDDYAIIMATVSSTSFEPFCSCKVFVLILEQLFATGLVTMYIISKPLPRPPAEQDLYSLRSYCDRRSRPTSRNALSTRKRNVCRREWTA